VLTGRIAAFLDEFGRFAVLATTNEDGTVHQAVTWYARREQSIVVNARVDRRWAANARRTARLSAAVADGQDYVIARGRVEVVDDPDVALADIRGLARRYGDDEAQFDGQQRVTFVLRPCHISVHGSLAEK
jgi:hypothetical protein